MSGVVSRLVRLRRVGTDEAVAHLRLVTPLHVIGPDADPLVIVVGEAGRALISARFAVPATVENAAVGRVGEDAVQARAVRGAYRGL